MKILSCSDPAIGSQIWLYELGDLEPADRERFESHLMICAACRSEVSRMRPVVNAVRSERADLLASLRANGVTFDRLRSEERVTWVSRLVNGILSKRRRWILVPAVAVVMAGLMLVLQRPSPSRYMGLLEFDPLLYERNSTREYEMKPSSDPFRVGMDEYCSGNYEEAAQQLSQAVRKDPTSDQGWLYLGVSYYLQREAGPAIKALRRAASSATPYLRDSGQWYLAQAFLLDNQADSAMTRINGLDQASRWRPRADSLVTRLKELQAEP